MIPPVFFQYTAGARCTQGSEEDGEPQKAQRTCGRGALGGKFSWKSIPE